ncbi:MAG: Enoyl-CoA hydratase/isomerase, partial [Chloroflexi bacterium]|nr:Enoyl-CoA hydratase/isomerase [Chloroflexota bacterium]
VAKSAVAMAAALRAIATGYDLPLEEGLAKEREQFGALAASEDAPEGVNAFLQKRAAQFKDK